MFFNVRDGYSEDDGVMLTEKAVR